MRVFVLQFSCWPVIYFNLMLMSADCLAPLPSMVIPGSQYSNFTFNIFTVLIYFWARVSTIKKYWGMANFLSYNYLERQVHLAGRAWDFRCEIRAIHEVINKERKIKYYKENPPFKWIYFFKGLWWSFQFHFFLFVFPLSDFDSWVL